MKKRLTNMAILAASALLLATTLPSLGTGSEERPLLGISLAPYRASFDLRERGEFAFQITNLSSKAIALPKLGMGGAKIEDASALCYVRAGMLKFLLRQGTNTLAMNPGLDAVTISPAEMKHSLVRLQPGETMRDGFSLYRDYWPCFFMLTNLGTYSLSITFDTRGCKEASVPKGVWSSAPATFQIVPFPQFRAKEPAESVESYAQAKVAFYLGRIKRSEGEWYANVRSLLQTPDSGAALIELMGSQDRAIAEHASSILHLIHSEETGQP